MKGLDGASGATYPFTMRAGSWLIGGLMAALVLAPASAFTADLSPEFKAAQLRALREDFRAGQRSVESCMAVVADLGEFTRCAVEAIWRPYGRPLQGVSRATLAGAAYGEFMMTAPRGQRILNGLMTLERAVKELSGTTFGTFCIVFDIDCEQLRALRMASIAMLPKNVVELMKLSVDDR